MSRASTVGGPSAGLESDDRPSMSGRGPIPRSIVTAWLLTRLATVLSVLITAERLGAGDIARYAAVGDALVHGENVRVWEYPVGSLLMTMPPNLLGASDYTDYLVVFMAVAVGFDFATFAMVLASRTSRDWNVRGAWIWVIAPALLGFITITRLDIAACCFAVAGISLLVQRRSSRAAGAMLAFGAAVKVWPALFLMAALALSRSRRQLIVGAIGASAFVLAAVLVLGWEGLLTDFLVYQGDRGLQLEAIAALPLLWLDHLGVAEYRLRFEFGSQQINGPHAEQIANASSTAMYVGLALLVAVCARKRHLLTHDPQLAMFAATVGLLLLVVTNKVFSPQYLLWIIASIAALASSRALINRGVIWLLMTASCLTHLLFPYLYAELVDGDLGALIVLTLRDACVLALFASLAMRLRRELQRRLPPPDGPEHAAGMAGLTTDV